MRVLHLNHSDINGGAARAAYRIHKCLCNNSSVASRLRVNSSYAGDWSIEEPRTKLNKILALLRSSIGGQLRHLLKTENPILHSPSLIPSNILKEINSSDVDIVHLHWVQHEMISISDIGRIEKPIVWTLHDMWAFCGAEHYTEDKRYRNGYLRNNRPIYESNFDLNRWTWKRKRKHWRRPMHIVAPSEWIASCVRESALMRDWPLDVISHPIDIESWRPIEQNFARELLGLPKDTPLLLFGALGGSKDPRKGFDLLKGALDLLKGEFANLELVVFGELEPRLKPDLDFPIHYAGHLQDDVSLRIIFSAVDVFALPSRQEAFSLTSMESLCCGTPVVAFNNSGPASLIDHKITGYLAEAFDLKDFAKGIDYILRYHNRAFMRESARRSAEIKFRPSVIAMQYIDIYQNIMKQQTND